MSPGKGPCGCVENQSLSWRIISTRCSWQGVPSEIPKGLTSGPNLLEMLLTELADGSDCTLSVCSVMREWEQCLVTEWWCCYSEGP